MIRKLRDYAATLLILAILLLDACIFEDPWVPPANKRTDTHEFKCKVNWHCGDVTARDDFEQICLIGEENDTPRDFEAQNPEWDADFEAMCAAALPGCDYPQCSVVCHYPKNTGCEPQ